MLQETRNANHVVNVHAVGRVHERFNTREGTEAMDDRNTEEFRILKLDNNDPTLPRRAVFQYIKGLDSLKLLVSMKSTSLCVRDRDSNVLARTIEQIAAIREGGCSSPTIEARKSWADSTTGLQSEKQTVSRLDGRSVRNIESVSVDQLAPLKTISR